MQNGKFIVFEGIDGSGKGTIIGMAREWLAGRGIPPERILVTKEPWTSDYGKKARGILASEKNPGNRAKELLNLYLSDRKEHLEKEILPALAKGKIVLCDRYLYSTIAYQAAQGEEINSLVEKNSGFTKPDICFILDLPVEDALERIEKDKKRDSKEMFEKKEFLQKARKNFLGLSKLFPGHGITIIDARGKKEETFGKIGVMLDKEKYI